MSNLDMTEIRLQAMIENAIKERSEWLNKMTEAQEHLNELDTRIAAIKHTLETYQATFRAGELKDIKHTMDVVRFNGRTIADSCERILLEAGHSVKVGTMVKILRDAKKIKGKYRNSYSHIYSVMGMDDRFARVGPGEFDLASRTHSEENME